MCTAYMTTATGKDVVSGDVASREVSLLARRFSEIVQRFAAWLSSDMVRARPWPVWLFVDHGIAQQPGSATR